MAHLQTLIDSKVKGINTSGDSYDHLIYAGAIDILEKIKTYKQEDLQKFIVEENVTDNDEGYLWSTYNATSVKAFEVMGVKRSPNMVISGSDIIPNRWKTATKGSVQNKESMGDINSLSYVTANFPAYIVESFSNVTVIDGDNDILAGPTEGANFIVTVFPQVTGVIAHAWKVTYIPIPVSISDTENNFHESYMPALASYVAKNIVLNEMNRLLLLEEDLELAAELKNHYALLEQEYAGLMNIPPKKEAAK